MNEFVVRFGELLIDHIFRVTQGLEQILMDFGIYDLQLSLQNAIWFFVMALIVASFCLFFYVVFVLIRAIFRLFWR